MTKPHENGKATLGLAVQVIGLVLFVIAPMLTMYVKVNELEVKLQEVETQFRAMDEFRNINLAGQMRFNSLLWQKAYGQSFPQEVYFPSIHK
jgi:hypothetical protein